MAVFPSSGRVFLTAPVVLAGLSLVLQGQGWKADADTRIRELRQREIVVRVLDAGGQPVPGARVSLRQKARAFPIGAAVNPNLLTNATYREFFKQHFNWAVFENASKWYANERHPGRPDYAAADAMLDWLAGNGIPVRGHCLFWEPEKWQLPWVRDLSPSELRAAVERRLVSAVEHFRGRFVHWDVNNEMLHGSFFKDRLGEEIHPWMFIRAHQLDPEAKLFVNEFNILSVDQNHEQVQVDEYVEHIRWLQSRGAPIHGIGIQGHIWHEDILSHPEVLKERLDRVAELQLPIWITEFDSADPDEGRNADILELVFRTAFSHPGVEGIMLWVFWGGSSWRGPNAGLAREDWTLNAAGRRFVALMEEWSTHVTGVTDGDGRFSSRGFLGEFELEVSKEGVAPVKVDFTLERGPESRYLTVTLAAEAVR